MSEGSAGTDRVEHILRTHERVSALENRVTAVEECLRQVREMPEKLTDLRIAVEGKFSTFATQNKITWTLLILVLGGLLGLAWAVLSGQAGVP